MPDTLLICHVLGLIVWCFLTFKELETLNSQSTQRLKINLENMAIKKIWRLLNSELIKAILSKDPWLKGLVTAMYFTFLETSNLFLFRQEKSRA